jgi:hypothetical protein
VFPSSRRQGFQERRPNLLSDLCSLNDSNSQNVLRGRYQFREPRDFHQVSTELLNRTPKDSRGGETEGPGPSVHVHASLTAEPTPNACI